MFSQKIIDSDAFLDMPLSAQALYFHLNMRADDDGFVNNPKRIQRTVGASDDDLKLLIMKRFILVFENGVIVIKHWRMHNTLRKDRYNPTQYQEQFAMLDVKDNNSYTEKKPNVDGVATTWQPLGNQSATQNSIEENSRVKISKGEERKEEKARQIADLFNSLCPSFPKVKFLSDSMISNISNLVERFPESDISTAFQKCEKSSFLKGNNPRKWKASFDWIIKPQNFPKILNGNYDDEITSDASYDLSEFRRKSLNEPLKYERNKKK